MEEEEAGQVYALSGDEGKQRVGWKTVRERRERKEGGDTEGGVGEGKRRRKGR